MVNKKKVWLNICYFTPMLTVLLVMWLTRDAFWTILLSAPVFFLLTYAYDKYARRFKWIESTRDIVQNYKEYSLDSKKTAQKPPNPIF